MSLEINVIVFSKDRAAQATACVRSLYKHFKEIADSQKARVTVLHKSSSEDFSKGYKKAQTELKHLPNLMWQPERDFQTQTNELVFGIDSLRTMFLVDDIIFVNPVSLSDYEIQLANHPMILATSLRLHSGITHCYATDTPSSVPKFVKKCVWNWATSEGDWAYPMSVDGNIYRTDFIRQIMQNFGFSTPNNFEAGLDSKKLGPLVPTHLSCYTDGPRLVNIPANRVQDQYKNRFAQGYTAEELNTLFLNGQEIDFDSYAGISPNTCHVPVELVLKKV